MSPTPDGRFGKLCRPWRCRLVAVVVGAVTLAPMVAAADPAEDEAHRAICRMVEEAAVSNHLPPGFLTRILWQESRFRADATSRAGAEGVAQFMPKTAADRGLLDPRQVGPAITHAARLLADHGTRFGNLGLAAAAYNAGAGRVARWLLGQATLPVETGNYVAAVTGRAPEEWAARRDPRLILGDDRPCAQVLAEVAASSARTAAWAARIDRVLAHASAIASSAGPPPRHTTTMTTGSSRESETLCNAIRSLGARCAVYQ